MTATLVTATGLLGLLVGSFLNVVVHRVPAGLSVVRPGSSCGSCGRPIAARDNVPVLSWLLLRGRCRHCGAAISARYPLVELTTGLVFAGVAAATGPTAYLPALLFLAAAGIALFVIDLEHQRLPFAITGTAGVGCSLLLLLDVWARGTQPVLTASLTALAWLAVYGGAWLATSGRGMGLGDVALAPVLGLVLGWFGWGVALTGLLGGFVLGALVGLVLVALAGAGRRARIPHGPFMLAGAALGLVVGADLWRGYLTMTGLTMTGLA
jgi:leader peptidase (prepilin peptidase)/N-methyltransferase